MRHTICKHLKRQEGFWSIYFILTLVTLAGMGIGAYVIVTSDSEGTENRFNALQADYAANGGAYYGLSRIGLGPIDESTPLTIGSCAVTLDTSEVSGTGDILLTIIATAGNTERGIQIQVTPATGLVDKAIYTTGEVFNVSGKDSLGNPDPTRVVTQADSVPSIDEDSLLAISQSQGLDTTTASFAPPTGYPTASFYQPDGVTPNIIYVTGDMVVGGGKSIYGIYIVTGNVTLHGSSRVNGVIYLPNETSTLITGGGSPSASTITGGIISHGNITGTGNHISVKHGPEYMRAFCNFQVGADPSAIVVQWSYI